MNSKIAFYLVLTAFLGLSGYLGLQIFSPEAVGTSESTSESNPKATSESTPGATPALEAARKQPRSSPSIWASDLPLPQEANRIDLKKSAELDQATRLLRELYRLSDKSTFLDKAQDLMNQFPQSPEFPAALADYHFNQGNLLEAKLYLQETLSRAPAYTLAKNTLGDVQMRLGEFQSAKETYREVFESGTDNLYAYQGFMGASAITGEEENAKSLLLQKYRAEPSKVNLALTIADIYFIEGNEAEREKVLRQAKRSNPDHPMLNHVLASDAFLKGQLHESIQYGQKAVDHDIDNQRKFSMLKTMLAAAEDLQDREQIAKIQQQLDDLRRQL
jgi:tetratricopeptide (TPR) repeat protein